MAKVKKKIGKKAELIFPLEKSNYIIIGIGILVIIAGYIALSVPAVEGFFPLVLAPILLVLGYCVIIPFGILYSKKRKEAQISAKQPGGESQGA
ncbi:MAG: hypothetical protein IGBAC_0556 [Ignavibacteriae bacterium]|nr:MAG: hypothetical protein IGBAC_0556 [Ignavibacteriota bacterium]